jgi:hypothetical protein
MRMTITTMAMRTALITQRTTDHHRKTPTFGVAPGPVMPLVAASAVVVVTSTTPAWTAAGLTVVVMVPETAEVVSRRSACCGQRPTAKADQANPSRLPNTYRCCVAWPLAMPSHCTKGSN